MLLLTLQSKIHAGRPKIGMFIAIPNALKVLCQDVSQGNWRIQAFVVNVNRSKLVSLITYFPTDPGNIRLDEGDLLEVLSVINDTLERNQFDNLVLTGEINAEFI